MRWEFFGGNLKGIIQKLPYLANLGITILYLNPIFEARSNHKYDTGDFLKIDPMFGDEAIFKELIEQAQTVGIHIILDGVFNHTGADSRYFNRYGTYDDLGAYQSRESEYADWYTFDQFPEEYQSWWGIKDVPTLNKETPAVQNFIYAGKDSVIRTWSKLGLGGWRIDVADELSDSFLAGIRKALEETIAEPVLIGEVWEDASNKIAYEQRRHYLEGGMLHGAMNYPFREIIIGVLNHTITTKEAALRSMHLKENYPPEAFKNNFNNIGTHDTARILTAVQNNVPALKQALALLFALPGIPCLYYGDEAGVEGGEDPANRKMFPWGRENKTIQSYAYEWIALRREEAALQEGDYYAFSTRKVLGIVRYLSEEEYLVLLINVSDQEVTFTTKEITADYSFDIQAFLTKQGLAEKTIPAQGIQVIKKSR
ncbi:MAG: glycoside hydrolase family 13 protein [Carnobacterium sp.]|uniref:glycoside hydrolase family 13 protein n=1 Tax=Carnobacterium sp. TaxID=48221 RepID=UPI002FC7A0D2